MKNCEDYIELISAYADNELSDADKSACEEHLSECENCSALLALYREISVAVEDSGVPAPESLSGTVMEKIQNEDAGTAKGGAGKRNVMRVILSRYVPIAACLVLMLLTLPRLSNLGCSSADTSSGGGAPLMDDTLRGEAQAGVSSALNDEGGAMASGGSGSSGPGSPSAQPAPNLSPFDGGAASPTEPASGDFTAGTSPDVEEQETDADTPTESPEESETSIEPATEPTEAATEPPVDPEASPTPEHPAAPPSPSGGGDDLPGDQDPSSDGLLTATIYAVIEIHGGLNEFLSDYVIDPVDDVAMYYEIPREYAEQAIEFLRGRDGVTITIVDESGTYAVIIYTPSG